MITIHLSKQQVLDTDPKAIQQSNFTGTETEEEIQQFFSLLKKQKKLFWIYSNEL